MDSTYSPPRLRRFGGVAAITGTGEFPCIDMNGDGAGKTLGGPSDFVFRFGSIVIEFPTADCTTGS